VRAIGGVIPVLKQIVKNAVDGLRSNGYIVHVDEKNEQIEVNKEVMSVVIQVKEGNSG
jgi:hypothetical protein